MCLFSKHPSHLLKEDDESLAEGRFWQQQAEEWWEIHTVIYKIKDLLDKSVFLILYEISLKMSYHFNKYRLL